MEPRGCVRIGSATCRTEEVQVRLRAPVRFGWDASAIQIATARSFSTFHVFEGTSSTLHRLVRPSYGRVPCHVDMRHHVLYGSRFVGNAPLHTRIEPNDLKGKKRRRTRKHAVRNRSFLGLRRNETWKKGHVDPSSNGVEGC